MEHLSHLTALQVISGLIFTQFPLENYSSPQNDQIIIIGTHRQLVLGARGFTEFSF